MNIVKINGFARGYHSNATYNESIYISEEAYNKIKGSIKRLEFSVSELDGKHSCCTASIEIEVLSEEDMLTHIIDRDDDGSRLYEILDNMFLEYELDLEADTDKVWEYINTLDRVIEMSVNVKQSQVELINKFIVAIQDNSNEVGKALKSIIAKIQE